MPNSASRRVATVGLTVAMLTMSVSAAVEARPSSHSSRAPEYAPGVVLVSFQRGTSPHARARLERNVGARGSERIGTPYTTSSQRSPSTIPATYVLRVPRGSETAVVERLSRARGVRFAEPDYLMHEDATPNDPSFRSQWGSSNTGQSVNGVSGTPGADDRATQAWNVTTGTRSVVVAEVDSGVDYNHPDLAPNVWSNPGGVGGCAAGTHGYNVLNSTCNPMDYETAYGGHGTHVAGIIGAVGNNGVGVAGMNWQTTILPVKWLDSNGNGSTSQLIAALDWVIRAKQAGVNVRVVNDSATYKGTAYSQALSDEIDALGANDILFVTAAGNTGDNNDDPAVGRYPCRYGRANEICVTASNQFDKLPSWANYGANTVDLAAPGDNIYSTLRNGTYGFVSGGSMASPQVAGAAALVLSLGYRSAIDVKNDLLQSVDVLPSLSGLVRTGGRLDVCKAIPGCSTTQPSPSPTPTATQQSTLGKTTIGTSSDSLLVNRKRANRYSLTASGSVSKLSLYLSPTSNVGTETFRGLIYADSSGSPGRLLSESNELSFRSGSSARWYDLPFATPVSLQPGKYWIGFISGGDPRIATMRWDPVASNRVYNGDTYSDGPSDPFGTPGGTDDEQMSLYATLNATQQSPTPAPTQTASSPSPSAMTATFGKKSVGASSDSFAADRKRVNRYALTTNASVSKLSIYLAPTGVSGQQVIQGVVYADAGGAPGARLAVSNQLTFHSTDAAGWYDLVLPAPLQVSAGNYWIGVITGGSSGVAGFRYDSVASSRIYNANTYSSGPSDPFGSSYTTDNEQMSLFATYSPR